MKKAALVLSYFPLALIFQILLIVNLVRFAEYDMSQAVSMESLYSVAPKLSKPRIQIAAATKDPRASGQIMDTHVELGDARPLLIEKILKTNQSPMQPYSSHLVSMADKYSIDWRMTTAIAGCESTFGKHVPLKAGYNAWGIAVYTGTQEGKEFNDWTHGIEYASKLIKERYKDKGHADNLITMGSIWAPPSVNTGNSWAKCVQFFMDQIK